MYNTRSGTLDVDSWMKRADVLVEALEDFLTGGPDPALHTREDPPMNEAAKQLGFRDIRHFCQSFPTKFDVHPTTNSLCLKKATTTKPAATTFTPTPIVQQPQQPQQQPKLEPTTRQTPSIDPLTASLIESTYSSGSSKYTPVPPSHTESSRSRAAQTNKPVKMADKLHFKVTRRGETKRFALDLAVGSSGSLMQRLEVRVAELVMDNFTDTGYFLYWRDEDSLITLKTDDDLRAAIDFATAIGESLNRLPCVLLEVRSAEERKAEQGKKAETAEEEQKKEAEPEIESSPTPSESAGAFGGVAFVCDGCECFLAPSNGGRFKCTICDNYDLCARCLAKGDHENHAFVHLRDSKTAIPISNSTVGVLSMDLGDIPRCTPTFTAARPPSSTLPKGNVVIEVLDGQGKQVGRRILETGDWCKSEAEKVHEQAAADTAAREQEAAAAKAAAAAAAAAARAEEERERVARMEEAAALAADIRATYAAGAAAGGGRGTAKMVNEAAKTSSGIGAAPTVISSDQERLRVQQRRREALRAQRNDGGFNFLQGFGGMSQQQQQDQIKQKKQKMIEDLKAGRYNGRLPGRCRSDHPVMYGGIGAEAYYKQKGCTPEQREAEFQRVEDERDEALRQDYLAFDLYGGRRTTCDGRSSNEWSVRNCFYDPEEEKRREREQEMYERENRRFGFGRAHEYTARERQERAEEQRRAHMALLQREREAQHAGYRRGGEKDLTMREEMRRTKEAVDRENSRRQQQQPKEEREAAPRRPDLSGCVVTDFDSSFWARPARPLSAYKVMKMEKRAAKKERKDLRRQAKADCKENRRNERTDRRTQHTRKAEEEEVDMEDAARTLVSLRLPAAAAPAAPAAARRPRTPSRSPVRRSTVMQELEALNLLSDADEDEYSVPEDEDKSDSSVVSDLVVLDAEPAEQQPAAAAAAPPAAAPLYPVLPAAAAAAAPVSKQQQHFDPRQTAYFEAELAKRAAAAQQLQEVKQEVQQKLQDKRQQLQALQDEMAQAQPEKSGGEVTISSVERGGYGDPFGVRDAAREAARDAPRGSRSFADYAEEQQELMRHMYQRQLRAEEEKVPPLFKPPYEGVGLASWQVDEHQRKEKREALALKFEPLASHLELSIIRELHEISNVEQLSAQLNKYLRSLQHFCYASANMPAGLFSEDRGLEVAQVEDVVRRTQARLNNIKRIVDHSSRSECYQMLFNRICEQSAVLKGAPNPYDTAHFERLAFQLRPILFEPVPDAPILNNTIETIGRGVNQMLGQVMGLADQARATYSASIAQAQQQAAAAVASAAAAAAAAPPPQPSAPAAPAAPAPRQAPSAPLTEPQQRVLRELYQTGMFENYEDMVEVCRVATTLIEAIDLMILKNESQE